MSDNFFIITGGPGSGKSTLIEALSDQGFQHMPEAGRSIIQDQVSIGGDALPWKNKSSFAELMLEWELRSYRQASQMQGPIIFDRGVPDTIGYLNLCGIPIAPHFYKAADIYRYNPTVFITPHWPEIFSQDAERKQSVEEALATYNAMLHVYNDLGYNLIEVPRISVLERGTFIKEKITQAKGTHHRE